MTRKMIENTFRLRAYNVMFTVAEVRKAEELGISENALRKRIKRGMTKRRALTQPPEFRNVKGGFRNERKVN